MKNRFWRVLLAALLALCMALPLFACGCDGNKTTTEATDPVTEAPTETVTEPDISVDPATFGAADITYNCQDDSVLNAYAGKTAEDHAAVCAFYKKNGYELYSGSEKNGSLFATYTNGAKMAHIYWLKNSGELNIVTSDTAGGTLPPTIPAVTAGNTPVTVTQIKDSAHVNGMGYVVQLADGSFIVYDGAYSDQARKFVKTMEDMLPEGEIPLIRAWVLTHSHNDHWPTFNRVADRMASKVKVEYVIFAPIDPEIAVSENGDTYFNTDIHEDIAKLGATAVYAHTGMEFAFCNLKMEVLLASDDIYKDNISHGAWFFNNSSLVTRLYGESYSFFALGDIGLVGSDWMLGVYGDYLKSDMVQIAHHGVEDVSLAFYETVKASILWYPCNQSLYDLQDRNNDVRDALRERDYTKEILIAGLGQYTRAWGTTFDANAPLSVTDHPTLGPKN